MIERESLDVFRADLESRRTELESECVSSNVALESFARACCEILCESGTLTEEPEFLMIDEEGYRLDAICWPDEDQPIVEFLMFLRQTTDEQMQREITTAFEKTTAILRMLCKPVGRAAVPETVEGVIRRIHKLIPNPDSILVRIITDELVQSKHLEKKLRDSLRRKLPQEIHTDFRFCDIKDLCLSSIGGTQGPSKEFPAIGRGSVRCFMVHEMEEHDVYLAAFPGQVLAAAFREHGQRLLQKNVRAFLGLKGKKNKKIRETLVKCPQRFLAYNNGLTITVTEIALNANHQLLQVADMQIVNGGQTIAVLADSFKQNDPQCLESVMVTAKIIHVKHQDDQISWIEKIAETSNTQNAIKDADLSSHNPVYLKIKELSTQTVFRKGTEQYRWYFSRVRNEYKAESEQNKKRGHTARKEFEATYPKEFAIEKGLVARAECVFMGKPWMASRGEAKCHFDFIHNLAADYAPDAEWYRELTGKIIMLREADAIAKENSIREGRSCIAEYACALLSSDEDALQCILRTHSAQKVPDAVAKRLSEYIVKARDIFAGLDNSRSTKEHAKREETWNRIRETIKT
jgi:hypothetical protein